MRHRMKLPGFTDDLRNYCIELRKKPIRQSKAAHFFVIPQNGPQILLDEPMKDQRHRLAA